MTSAKQCLCPTNEQLSFALTPARGWRELIVGSATAELLSHDCPVAALVLFVAKACFLLQLLNLLLFQLHVAGLSAVS